MKFKLILISTMLLLLGCSLINGPNKQPSFENFSYPLEVGNKWTYERTSTHSNIRPDTSHPWFSLIVKGSAVIEVTAIDSTEDSLRLYVLSTSTVDSLIPLSEDSATFLFRNEEDGLYEYGNSGGNLAVPISRPPTKKELEQRFLDKNIKNKLFNTLLDSEIKQSLEYPIKLGNKWMFIDSTNNLFGIHKRIIGFEQLETKIGKQSCFVIEWIYSDFNFDVQIIDYISEIGLIRRTISAKDVQTTDPSNTNHITYDYVYEYNLVEFTLAK